MSSFFQDSLFALFAFSEQTLFKSGKKQQNMNARRTGLPLLKRDVREEEKACEKSVETVMAKSREDVAAPFE